MSSGSNLSRIVQIIYNIVSQYLPLHFYTEK